jgi:hypothetical protein
MKRSRFTEEQITAALREQQAGAKTADVCRKHGVSEAAFYKRMARRLQAVSRSGLVSLLQRIRPGAHHLGHDGDPRGSLLIVESALVRRL